MDIETFNTAKSLHEKIEKLKYRQSQLEAALKSCSLSTELTYFKPPYGTKHLVNLFDKEGIKEIIRKEIDKVVLSLSDLEKEFENL